jgi:allophanate hydrolase subunit 1
MKPKILPLGDSALLIRFGDEINLEINQRVHALACPAHMEASRD